MIIIGAGMAGLLAAGMLRNEAQGIVEAQASLPNNHSAVLRFRSSVVGDVLNIPFKKVTVIKAIDGGLNPIAAMLAYSLKTNGTATMRSSISAKGEMAERFIAPPDLIQQMADRVACPIEYGKRFVEAMPAGQQYISTIPMPILMNILDWPGDVPDFRYISGYNINVELSNVDAYATLYVPDRVREENRISLTGNRLTIEVALPHLSRVEVLRLLEARGASNHWLRDSIEWAMDRLGLLNNLDKGVKQVGEPTVSPAEYAKILPIDESIRRSFIIWASETHRIFSLGRFATWRPGLMQDDLVNDVRVINSIARHKGGAGYDQRKR